MRKITLRELPDWPPEPGGAYESGTVFPVAGEAVVIEIFPVSDAMVTFRGEFGKYPHSYHYKASSEKSPLRSMQSYSRIWERRSQNLGTLRLKSMK
jgi:hypothetical protein